MTMKPDPINRLQNVGTRTIFRTYPVGVGVDRGSPGDVREGHVKVKCIKIQGADLERSVRCEALKLELANERCRRRP